MSRWDRLQDVDKSANYEYVCKSSGVPILYCIVTFTNDNSTGGLILEALKRTMAGEYSRKLSTKRSTGSLQRELTGRKQTRQVTLKV